MVKLKKKENLVARNEIKVEDSQENKINNNCSNKSDKLNPYKVFIKKHPEFIIHDNGDGTYGFISK